MQDIVAQSHLSPGAIYLYFHSKDEIIQAIADDRQQFERQLFADIFADVDANAALLRIARHFFSSLKRADVLTERNIDIQLWGEAMVHPEVFRVVAAGFQETKQALAEVIRKYQNSGKADPAFSPEATAQVMLALFQGFALQMQLDHTLNVEEFICVVEDLIHHHFD